MDLNINDFTLCFEKNTHLLIKHKVIVGKTLEEKFYVVKHELLKLTKSMKHHLIYRNLIIMRNYYLLNNENINELIINNMYFSDKKKTLRYNLAFNNFIGFYKDKRYNSLLY